MTHPNDEKDHIGITNVVGYLSTDVRQGFLIDEFSRVRQQLVDEGVAMKYDPEEAKKEEDLRELFTLLHGK